MTTLARQRSPARAITCAWIVLSAITVLSWWLAPGQRHGATSTASLPVTAAVVLLGLVKGRLVIRYFMEVRTAPRWLRVATDGWLIVLWSAVLLIYLF